MDEPWMWMLTLGGLALLVIGMRGVADIRSALHAGELDRLLHPLHWRATRLLMAALLSLPVGLATAPLGGAAWGSVLVTAGLGYALAPVVLAEARRRAQIRLLDELALHLDLIASAMEAGSSLISALNACAERAPEGPLRRAWARVVLEVHAGADLQEVLRDLDLRIGLRSLGSVIMAMRSAERAGVHAGAVLRERARQAAASRFARAERLARAAPLKLWATLMLCIVPCTLLVLAFPVAQLLALLAN